MYHEACGLKLRLTAGVRDIPVNKFVLLGFRGKERAFRHTLLRVEDPHPLHGLCTQTVKSLCSFCFPDSRLICKLRSGIARVRHMWGCRRNEDIHWADFVCSTRHQRTPFGQETWSSRATRAHNSVFRFLSGGCDQALLGRGSSTYRTLGTLGHVVIQLCC